jgi:alpha-L-fucosidase
MGVVADVSTARAGIVRVTHGSVDLARPLDGSNWYYGVGLPIQLDATTGGLLVNIRRDGTPFADFEAGTDLIKFNSLDKIDAANAVPISRPTNEPNPWTGAAAITSKYPVIGGFVPLGGRFVDGSLHPHGGTGFGMCEVGFYPAESTKPLSGRIGYLLEVQQFSYDGSRFAASAPLRMSADGLPVAGTGWNITAPGMSPAIPDGNDLLFAAMASNASQNGVSGVARFQYSANGWQPTSFVPITGPGEAWIESSLIRDVDGSLLFSSRSDNNTPLVLWRSTNAGNSWNQLINAPSARTYAPVVLGQAVDGSAFFVTNPKTTINVNIDRNVLDLVPIKPNRTELDSAITVRDAPTDFGAAPSGLGWMVDHGVSNVIRLADGRWHSILTYRVDDQGEHSGSPGTPYTGCYVEEVFSSGDPRPMGLTFVPEPTTGITALLTMVCMLGFHGGTRRRAVRLLPEVVRLWPLVLVAVLLNCCQPLCQAAESTEVETDPLVLKKLDTFQDWKFGLFVHWGLYSQWGCPVSWPLVEEDKWARPDDLPAWIERGKDFRRFAADYVKLNETFNPRHFDPQSWVDAASHAGMKYMVFTTKHHDGFCMFDTKQTDYRTTASTCPFHANPRADTTKAVFDTFHKAGFGIGAYYSKSDWHHPGYWDPARLHPMRGVNYDTAKEPQRWASFVNFTHNTIEEIVSGYGPIDILWLDGDHVRPPSENIDMPAIAAMVRKHQPGMIIVDRNTRGRYENYRTPEQEVPKEALPYVWESCITLNSDWGYKPNDEYKSTRYLIHLLVDIAAKGGNLLLNVGPDPDGRFPEPAIERLEAMGQWMKINGEGIYGTRAVAPYKVGRTCLTQKGSTVYLIYLADKDESAPPPKVVIPAVVGGKAVRMLGTQTPVHDSFDPENGLTIEIPQEIRQNVPCRHAWTFAVTEAKVRK